MDQILHCDWLRPRVITGLLNVSRKKNFSEAEAGLPKFSFLICDVKNMFCDSQRFT